MADRNRPRYLAVFPRSPWAPALCLLASLAIPGGADEVRFSKVTLGAGQTQVFQVIHYDDGVITLRSESGAETSGPIDRLKRIEFGGGEQVLLDKRLLAEAERVRREKLDQLKSELKNGELSELIQKHPPAVVAMYVDTKDPSDGSDLVRVNYRCVSGEATGSGRGTPVPLRAPWAFLEFAWPQNGSARTIHLEPEVPYKPKRFSIELEPGGIVNLGRVTLERNDAEATVRPQAEAMGSAAEITFKSGQVLRATVLSYEESEITIRDEAGKEFSGPIDRIQRIEFGNTPREISNQLLAEIERVRHQKDERYEGSSTTAVALYLDTEDPNDWLDHRDVVFRFYMGNGFQAKRIPLRTPWAIPQVVIPDRPISCRIELVPGRPYQTKSIPIDLREGGIINLGRIVLKKAPTEEQEK